MIEVVDPEESCDKTITTCRDKFNNVRNFGRSPPVNTFEVEVENFRWQADCLLADLEMAKGRVYYRLWDRVDPGVWESWIKALRATIARMEALP